jgi:hypothetical protein
VNTELLAIGDGGSSVERTSESSLAADTNGGWQNANTLNRVNSLGAIQSPPVRLINEMLSATLSTSDTSPRKEAVNRIRSEVLFLFI